ncbi:nuclear transport factor 2 family protein [Microlunatus speluncae]|uniref:nuclear transport factor 2 family protein n=1 Tax=Microlunatus speluncae TaxID=2594267 RepID=UPI001266519C|nr:nuclear transport factor 2 family protein [Microlunatus speluncae]
MTTTTTGAGVDGTALIAATTRRDAATLTAFYAGDAVINVVDRDHPPASPLVLIGTEEIGAYFRDICGRDIVHTVPQLVADANGVAFEQHCRYPEGNSVTCLAVSTVRDGKIIRQTIAQAWD